MQNQHFKYKNGQLFCDDVNLNELAGVAGSPTYVYSKACIEKNINSYLEGLKDTRHSICYSVKALSNTQILKYVHSIGCGFDIVSAGELYRVLEACGDASKVVFSGVGKTYDEIEYALDNDIFCFNVESEGELDRIAKVAKSKNKKAPIAMRINPGIDGQTHPYITTGMKKHKFGLVEEACMDLYRKAASQKDLFEITGISCHIGSQITTLSPFLDSLDKVLDVIDKLAKEDIKISHIDFGGGLGVSYEGQEVPRPKELSEKLIEKMADRDISLVLEPGRSIVAEAGALVCEVIDTKSNDLKNFLIIDGAMNDLIRPALYQSYHPILSCNEKNGNPVKYDVVGPICETGDFFALDRELYEYKAGEFIAVLYAGAYGMVMANNYNTRGKPAEVLVDGDKAHVIASRESFSDMIKNECSQALKLN